MRLAPCCFNLSDDDDELTKAIKASPFYGIYSEKLIKKDKGAFYVYKDKHSLEEAVLLVETTYKADDAVIEALNKSYKDAKINTAPLDVYVKGGNSLFDKLNAFDYNDIQDFISIASKQDEEFYNAIINCYGHIDDLVELVANHGDEFAEDISFIYSHHFEKNSDELFSFYQAATRKNSRVFNELTDSRLSDKIMNVRKEIPSEYKKTGNMALASFDGEIVKKINEDYLYAHSAIDKVGDLKSKQDSLSEFAFKPEESNFSYLEIVSNGGGRPFPRNVDSEFKILCEIDNKICDKKSITGEIILLTEKAPCESCKNVIFEFLNKYENISITVIDNNGNKFLS